jgi:anti-anti-sigma regulatory factor
MSKNKVKLNGDLSVFNAVSVKKTLSDALKTDGDITIDLRAAEKMDISLMQLLIAFHNTCLKKNRKIKIDATDKFWSLLDNMGYSRGELLVDKDN